MVVAEGDSNLDAEEFYDRCTTRLKDYTTWIVPPATSSDKYTFNIKLVKQVSRVGQTVLTEKGLRKFLMKNLPPKHSSPISVDMFINCARSGSLDMRSLANISLSDEAARNLGWIW